MTRTEKLVAMLVTAAIYISIAGAINRAPLPKVYTANGECVRVLVIEDGKEVEGDCSTIDLKNGRYDHSYAASDEEVAELKMAATR